MGLFGKLFEKKSCDICGGDIGLLGNRKLEDGNLCKNCAAKLSPWFSERRSSTVASNLREANPDVLDYSQVTGCKLDIDESRSELKREDAEGKEVSYNPPRYEYEYDFYIVINVNHPYFDTIRFKINRSSIEVTPPVNRPGANATTNIAGFARNSSVEFRETEQIGKEIVSALTGARQQVRDEAAAANAPKIAVTCPFCSANTIPDAMGRCEYCGGSVNG